MTSDLGHTWGTKRAPTPLSAQSVATQPFARPPRHRNRDTSRLSRDSLVGLLVGIMLASCARHPHTYRDAEGSGACTQDCSGHEAGWRWAQVHHINDPDRCGGNSESFIEGCRAFAQDGGE